MQNNRMENCKQFADENSLLMGVLRNCYLAGAAAQKQADLAAINSLVESDDDEPRNSDLLYRHDCIQVIEQAEIEDDSEFPEWNSLFEAMRSWYDRLDFDRDNEEVGLDKPPTLR